MEDCQWLRRWLHTTGCLLDYSTFKKHYKLIAIDLTKQEKLDADPKTRKQINFTGNPENNATIFFIVEEAKETVYKSNS